MELKYITQPTPNPNAQKFILNKDIKSKGKVTVSDPEDCEGVPMAADILNVPHVTQVHFFENVITVTQDGAAEWSNIEEDIIESIKSNIQSHNPDFIIGVSEEDRRAALPEDLRKIEDILDRTVRPGLQSDGGDLIVNEYDAESKTVTVQYQGACMTCPSSTMGTLFAIKGVLQDEFDPEIEVVTAGQESGVY